MSKFHQSKEWIALAKLHKALMRYKGRWKCRYCRYTGDEMESEHVLPVAKYPMFKLWLFNLVLSCGPCNKKKGGAKVYLTLKSV